jgi:uncharacterized damage-inducible protein DinB
LITPEHARLMARYNKWQNESLYREAEKLDEAQRLMPRGAFFGSIQGTLSHLLWGDAMWMHRFAGTPKPEGGITGSAAFHSRWDGLVRDRTAMDETIIVWSVNVTDSWLQSSTTWTRSTGGVMTRPNWVLATHFFNHQTHHRGQVHAMLTAAGARPDDTDLIVLDPFSR